MAIAVAIVWIATSSIIKALFCKNRKDEKIFTLDEVITPDKDENENAKSEMLKELDQNHPFDKKISGSLTGDAFMKLRKVINKHAYKKFVVRKQELMEERLKHFKNQDM